MFIRFNKAEASLIPKKVKASGEAYINDFAELATVALIAGLGGILSAYNMMIVSGMVRSLSLHFSLSPSQLGLTMSSALWGTLLGSIIFGVGANLTPRVGIRVLAVGFVLAAVGSALASSLSSLIFFRFLAGTAVGGSGVVIPSYLAQRAPPAFRGRIVGIFQFTIGLGVVFAYTVIYRVGVSSSLHSEDWRFELGGAALPAIFLLLLVCIPSDRTADSTGFRFTRAAFSTKTARFTHSEEKLFTPRNLRPIVLAAGLAIFNQATGINAILYYLNDTLQAAHGSRSSADLLACKLGLLNLAFGAIGIQLVDYVGRRKLLLWGSIVMTACLLLVGHTLQTQPSSNRLFLLFVLFNATFGLSQGPVIWTYLSEIFRPEVRVKGLSWGSAVLWAMNGLVTFLFALARGHSRALPFFVFAAATAVQFFVIFSFYPETMGAALGDLGGASAASTITPNHRFRKKMS
jgi:SP family arabinose:H+ symporter-like MFS transporter